MSENRVLKAHKNLLMDVIKRQAGTVSKAILEGVMNSIDAEATECRVGLTDRSLTIEDDGKGLQDLKFFETFGQPHEDGDAVYGTFRMGRGQLFAFGRNVWKTAQFHLDVDVKNKGLDYVCRVDDDKNKYPGCAITVEFYEKLQRVDMASVENDLRAFVKYSQIPVYFNGERISKDADKVHWQHEEEGFRARFTAQGSLSIYNLGVLICTKPYYSYGVGGEIVSKKQVKVNFARNDVMSDCPIWRKIVPLLNAASGKKKKKREDEDDRIHYAQKISSGMLDERELWRFLHDKKAITDVRGRHCTANTLLRYAKVTTADDGNKRGDVLMQHDIAFVVSRSTLERFEVDSLQDLMDMLIKAHKRSTVRFYEHAYPEVVHFDDLASEYVSDYRPVDESKYTPKERVWIRALSHMHGWLTEGASASRLRPGQWHRHGSRNMHIGESDNAIAAWTDGSEHIWVNRSWLAGKDYSNLANLIDVGTTLVHEYAHDDSSKNTDEHGPEFYENFHHGMRDANTLARWIREVVNKLPEWISIESSKESRAFLRTLDKLDKYGECSKRLTANDRELRDRYKAVMGESPPLPALRKRKRQVQEQGKAACPLN